MNSPFVTHREKVLGDYGAASWLRLFVLAMWNGNAYPVGLSHFRSLDRDHATAALEMLASYRENGENDREFMALADACRARLEEEKLAARRDEDLEWWMREAGNTLRSLGQSASLTDDRYNWFEAKFNSGMGPGEAAHEAVRVKLS